MHLPWGTYDLVVFKVIWWSFGAYASNWPVNCKGDCRTAKRSEFGTLLLVIHVWNTFDPDLVVVFVVSESLHKS